MLGYRVAALDSTMAMYFIQQWKVLSRRRMYNWFVSFPLESLASLPMLLLMWLLASPVTAARGKSGSKGQQAAK